MRKSPSLKEVTGLSATVVILPPIGICVGVLASLGNDDRWYTLYPFVSLAVLSLLFGVYFIPKVMKLNRAVCSQSEPALQEGRLKIRGLLTNSLVVGLLLGTGGLDFGSRWGLGLLAGLSISALLDRVSELSEFWDRNLGTQSSELEAI